MASAVEEPLLVWLNAEDLQCSICLCQLSNPATVECGHSFCLDCIRKWLTGQHGKCQCPNCKHHLGDKLPERNVLLNSLLEKCPASGSPLPTETSRLAEPALPAGAGCKWEFQDYIFQTRSSISEAFGFMKKCICDQEKLVLRMIEEEWKAVQQLTDSTDKQLNGKIHKILDFQNKSEETMKKTSGQGAHIGHPMQKISNMVSAVEELRRQLEASILKNFPVQPSQTLSQDSIQEAISSSSAAPSTRDRELPMISSSFSQWMSVITFDDERIGCMLELTDNKRKMRVSRVRKEYEPTPKRFRNSQVLGSPSFSEGCHYWEINTKDSSAWAIGVASGDIGRNDRLGRNELSWCIECNPQGISAWHNTQETKIDEVRPLRVGVFLDFPTKRLSFYSLTDKETCLHKFEINVADPVYPAFWIFGLNAGESLTINDITLFPRK